MAALPIPQSIYIKIRYSKQQSIKQRSIEEEKEELQGSKRNRAMRTCEGLGVIETIYEEDEEDDSFSNPLSSFNLSPQTSPSINLSSTPYTFPSSSPDPLQMVVNQWSTAFGFGSNVLIRVQGHCFFLHREPMSFHSRYLRRRLTKSDDVSLSPPLNITVETLTEVVRFCYGRDPILTPSNVAAVRVAAELLEMDENDGDSVRGSLIRLTEDFLRQEIDGDKGRAAVVLQCCVRLLPESGEPAADMAARCVQLLTVAAVVEEDENFDEWIVDLMEVPAKSFGMIMESMARWSVHDHDHLYRLADRYFTINGERVSEEEKLRICHVIDCSKLSHHLLLDLVQNSRLPLRFIFKAMLISHRRPAAFSSPLSSSSHGGDASLRDLLHHDAAARQAANLAVRIESLERDVAGLRRHLRWSEDKRAEMVAGRSKSFRHRSGGHSRCYTDSALVAAAGKEKRRRGLGRKLVDGFRSMFRISGVAVV